MFKVTLLDMKKMNESEIKELKDELMEDMLAVYKHEGNLTQEAYHDRGGFSLGVVYRIFKNWSAATDSIGIINKSGRKEGSRKRGFVACGKKRRRIAISDDKLECEYMKNVLVLTDLSVRICSVMNGYCPNVGNVEPCLLLKVWRKKGVAPDHSVDNYDPFPISGTIAIM